jgi:hypothetical protein
MSADIDVAASGGTVFSDHLEADAFDDEYVVSVPRTGLSVGVWAGTEGCSLDRGLKIPYGQDSPAVYTHCSKVDADCESLRELVCFRKNHCRMNLRMRGFEMTSLKLVLHGNVDGYEADGSPSEGEFMCECSLGEDNACCVILPRQIDDSLVLELADDRQGIKRFALGHYIVASGYDWTKPDLDDISVDLDFSVTDITLVIQGWETEHKFDIVI